jgi:hypothetical protein
MTVAVPGQEIAEIADRRPGNIGSKWDDEYFDPVGLLYKTDGEEWQVLRDEMNDETCSTCHFTMGSELNSIRGSPKSFSKIEGSFCPCSS